MEAPTFVCAAVLSFAMSGCGPSFADLMQRGQPPEALCRASNEREATSAVVAELKPLRVEWKAIPIRRTDVPKLADDVATDSFDRFWFAIVETRLVGDGGTVVKEIDAQGLKVETPVLVTLADRYPMLLTTPTDFTAITQEPPPKYVEKEEETCEPVREIDLLTLGLSRLNARCNVGKTTVISPDYDFARDAPKASALYRAFTDRFGQREIWVVPRSYPKKSAARVTADLDLRYESRGCYGHALLTLEGEPFDLESADWPDFAPLSMKWVNVANVDTGLTTYLGDSELTHKSRSFELKPPE